MNDVMYLFSLPILQALLWLVAALVVATIAKAVARGIVGKTKLKPHLAQGSASARDAEKTYASTRDYVGNLVFLLTFLLFVPAIFTTLGVGNAAEPILNLLDGILGFLPNVIGAGIVLVAGLLIARLVRQLLIPVFARIRVDRLQERAGIKVADSARLSTTLASVVYVMIVVPVIVVALQILDISAISVPATNMLNTVIGFVPNILAGVIVIALGVFVGRLAGSIVGQLVASTGVDGRLSQMTDGMFARMSLSRVLNIAVQVIIITLFALEGIEILQLDVLRGIGTAVVAYLPNVLAACVVFVVAAIASSAAGKALKGGTFGRYAPFLQVAIWVLAAFMVLTQLNIAEKIVQDAFVLILAAVCVAFALAFGLGGREFAKDALGRWSRDMDRVRAEQSLDQMVE